MPARKAAAAAADSFIANAVPKTGTCNKVHVTACLALNRITGSDMNRMHCKAGQQAQQVLNAAGVLRSDEEGYSQCYPYCNGIVLIYCKLGTRA